MSWVFFVAAAVALLATLKAITETRAVRALLDLIVSLLATAVIFFLLGAPFAAALELIIYAGAIMVLFVFVAMLLNLGPQSAGREREWQRPGMWLGPGLIASALLAEIVAAGVRSGAAGVGAMGPRAVGAALFGPYAAGVELASLLLLAGLIGARHLGGRG